MLNKYWISVLTHIWWSLFEGRWHPVAINENAKNSICNQIWKWNISSCWLWTAYIIVLLSLAAEYGTLSRYVVGKNEIGLKLSSLSQRGYITKKVKLFWLLPLMFDGFFHM